MRRIYFRFFTNFFRSKYILFFCFFSGLLFSFAAANSAGEAIISTMRMVTNSHVSIICLLFTLLFPVFISAYAVYSNESWIIVLLAFLKAFAFGYCAFAILATFRNAGWLVYYLLLFPDIHLLCILWCFWLRNFPARRQHLCASSVTAALSAIFVWTLDYLLIAPFWVLLQQ